MPWVPHEVALVGRDRFLPVVTLLTSEYRTREPS